MPRPEPERSLARPDGIRRALLRAESGAERFLAFEQPLVRLTARAPAEVPALLERAEAAAAAGQWAVGFVAYETAPGFDAAFVTHRPAAGPAPLAAFSIFAAPRELPARTGAAAGAAALHDVTPGLTAVEHAAAVARIRAAIGAGATYQVNFVFACHGTFSGRPEDLLAHLLAPGEAPFAALLEGDSWAVLSLSPELFFERRAGALTMRPMKGTRPRGRWPAEDRVRAAELAAAAKDRAENLMIVDMARNDLGRVATPGTVRVERVFAVERYPTVWQMTSTVAAAAGPEARLPALFSALFPCASVTGAPKVATMAMIRELEREPRGVYCGAVGRVEPGGRARFAVAIRTLELDLGAGTFRYGVGSGVTWDSDPDAEWRECLDKARVLAGAPPEFELLETMRWRPGEGIALLDLHLERLAASADYFGFQAKAEDKDKDKDKDRKASIEGWVRAAVAARCAELALGSSSYRVRLRLARGGGLAIAVDPFEPSRRAWRVAVARPPDPSMEALASAPATASTSASVISSESVFAFHKTSLRAPYEAALAAAPPGVDEVLLVNERGELTEGTRTNVALQFGGEWVTPPLEAGLLPGVFREHLLRSGRLVEATLYPRDLRRAHRVRLMNALRGWIPVELDGFDKRPRG